MSKKEEIWKDIDGYEGIYQVSNMGQVRSYDRIVRCGFGYYLKKGRILKQRKNITKQHSYKDVILSVGGKMRRIPVHILVAETFIGPYTRWKYAVNHKDGNKLNNCLDNLEIVTYYENNIHALKHKLKKCGWEKEGAKFTYQDVCAIRKMWGEGASYKNIAKQFNTDCATVNTIVRNIIYRDPLWDEKKQHTQRILSKRHYNKEIVDKIRQLFISGATYKNIAQQLDVSNSHVGRIVRNEIYYDPNYVYVPH